MPIMKFNTPPQARVSERAQQTSHGDSRSLQHAVSGTHVEGGGQTNTLGPNVELATKWSTAPYTGPPVDEVIDDERPNSWGYRSPKRAKRCMANDDTCKAWATKSSDYMYCHPHHRLAQGKPAWSANEKPEDE